MTYDLGINLYCNLVKRNLSDYTFIDPVIYLIRQPKITPQRCVQGVFCTDVNGLERRLVCVLYRDGLFVMLGI